MPSFIFIHNEVPILPVPLLFSVPFWRQLCVLAESRSSNRKAPQRKILFYTTTNISIDIDSLLTASAEAAFNRIELALEHINKLKSTTEGSYNKDVKELYDRLYWDEDLSDVATDLAGMLTVRKDITPWENKIYKYEDVPEDDVVCTQLVRYNITVSYS